MSVLTIRNVDEAVKSALEVRAKEEGVSQSSLARRLLADSLGVKVKKRNLRGLGERLFTEEQRRELAKIDGQKPCFADEELDHFMAEEDERIAEEVAKLKKLGGT